MIVSQHLQSVLGPHISTKVASFLLYVHQFMEDEASPAQTLVKNSKLKLDEWICLRSLSRSAQENGIFEQARKQRVDRFAIRIIPTEPGIQIKEAAETFGVRWL